MKIPKRLKIGGFIWSVEENDKVAKEGNAYGSTHHTSQSIYLDPTATQQKKEHTLIHEAMHSIWWQSGLNDRYKKTPEIEEEVIQAMAHGLYQVLKDNKLLK